MAATRKLQGEIDRCLKKVAEGVETFEDIWKKVHNATNSNQKKIFQEKYEADLKKEIKKLQRLRDQIKSWIASAEIKDKSQLLENRRLIETQMERFKVVERETKTKAYSKEGLGAAQKMDPAQRIKDETRNWLTGSISNLQIQIDQYESEVESLLAGKKKRLDRDKQDRMEELRGKLDRHKFHITKLETLLRLLDNDGVEADQVNKIKDDVEYYIDSSQDPDFEENEFIYDDIIGLDEVELSGTATTDSNNSNETSGSPSSITSGGSPPSSPPPQTAANATQPQPTTTVSGSTSAQQQTTHVNNLNYSGDATSLTATTAADTALSEKQRSKSDNANNKTKQPVKPTAVRASNNNNNNNSSSIANKTPSVSIINSTADSINISSNSNKIVSSTPSKNHQQHLPQQQIQQQTTAAAVVAASLNNANTMAATVAAATAVQQHNPTVQQHAPAPSLNANATNNSATSAAAAVGSSATALANSNNSIQGQSVIQATPTAFATVAKNNTSQILENGPTHVASSYGGMTVSAAAAQTVASIVVGSNTQQQLSNLQANSSSHLQQQNTTTVTLSNNNNTSNSSNSGSTLNSIANAVQQQQQQNKNSSLANCISPNGLVANLAQVISVQQQQQQQHVMNVVTNNATRASPGALSPKHMNGLPVTLSNNSNAVDAISLKTMAQEAINRSVIDTNALTQATTMDNRQSQQQQQQQQVLQQHFNTESTANQQQQQQQQNQVAVSAAAAAAVAAASGMSNGPTNVGANVSAVCSSLSAGIGSNAKQQPTNEAHIPPLLGVAPLGPSPLQKDHQMQFQLMEAAYYHLPVASDSEKLTTYFHRSPMATPPHYPQSTPPIYDTVEFYQRLSTETLFFVFYYMEGSKAQYLAAKALKKQSWRFHTKYMMWFQRHEEPKIINDDYEQGTYIYFDYEKWSQRKKEGFTFEYKYLEDKELN